MLAQAADATSRAMQLEEEVRALNGKVEDLTFQLLQLQETLRKMQEDNEFRFQELESGKQGAVRPADGSQDADAPQVATEDAAPGKSEPSEQDAGAQRSDGDEIAGLIEGEPSAPGKAPRMIDGVEVYDGPSGPASSLEPRNLGTLRFDENGNVIEAAPGDPVDLSNPPPSAPVGEVPVEAGDLPPPTGVGEAVLPGVETGTAPQESGGQVASLAMPDDPAQLYELGYGYVQAGDYKQAEAAFRQFTTRHQDDARMGEASFWLGESVFAQRRYEEAAKIFLDAHKKYPDNALGAQNLLKLGVSLAGMNQRELACATFAEVPNKYPKLSNAVRAKLQAEQKAISCTTN